LRPKLHTKQTNDTQMCAFRHQALLKLMTR
jgi:hypothetical protein